MSGKVWGICLSVFAAFILTVVFSYWYFGREAKVPPQEQRGTELVELLPARISPEQVSASDWDDGIFQTNEGMAGDESPDGYAFLLVDRDNYVTVYQLPEREIYEYTDVILDVLPVGLQEEIRAGKYLKNEEELYNFLENYTS